MEITSPDKCVILNILVVVFHQEVCIGSILSMSSLSELEKQPKVEQGLWLMVFGPEAAVLKLELELIVYLLTGSILRRGFCHSPANTYNLQQAHHIFFLLVNNNSVFQ